MSKITNFLKRFKDKFQAFRAAQQAGIAHQFAQAKAGRRVKASKSIKLPYVWGTLHVSAVSERIKKDYGAILSRAERKRIAKETKTPFRAYYNN